MTAITRKLISNCRICDAENFEDIILLKEMPLTDEFITKEKIGSEFIADILISICKTCGSAQNRNNTEMSDYYFDYTYTVNTSGFALEFMKILAQNVKLKYFKNINIPSILEIGSGTGEQLSEFKKIGFNVVGVEPSEKLSAYANSNGIKTLNIFFDENTKQITNHTKFDAVVTSYTFDHIPSPVEVLKNIYNILTPEGILIIEVHDLELIRKRNEFCLFEHEHYTYLNEKTLTSLLNKNQFEVLTFKLLERKDKRANSLLVVAKKTNEIINTEINVLDEISKLKTLNNDISNSVSRIEKWLEENKNFKIMAYGAGGRGIMTIAALKNSSIINCIIDKNPKNINIYSPKSHLPVFGINHLETNRPDKILIFSFGYYNEIVNELINKYNYKENQFYSILDLLETSHA